MILHPGVLALLVGSTFVLALAAVACWHAGDILRHWDLTSSSARQLRLEQRTHLVSAILRLALAYQVLSCFLFVYTADDLHRLLAGAMCATGSLNANPVGWWALLSKIGLAFAAALWLALNALDQRVEDYPLVRTKYALLLLLSPFLVADFALQALYFLGLTPDIITSCCGSLFSEAGSGLTSTLASVAPMPALVVFYGSTLVFFAVAFLCAARGSKWLRLLLAALSVWMLPLSIVAIVSFFSLYLYQTPSHHCPFDFLQASYHFLGYPLYLGLAVGVFFGLLPGVLGPFRSNPSLAGVLTALERRWITLSILGMGVFVLLLSYPVLFSPLRLRDLG